MQKYLRTSQNRLNLGFYLLVADLKALMFGARRAGQSCGGFEQRLLKGLSDGSRTGLGVENVLNIVGNRNSSRLIKLYLEVGSDG